MMKLKLDNSESKYPIHKCILEPYGEIRYWYDDEKNIHIAVWSGETCILTDNDTPLSSIIKVLVKNFIKSGQIIDSSLKDRVEISLLNYKLSKAKRQRNHYSKLLKEKNELIREIKFEAKRWAELYGKAVTGELFESEQY